MTALLSYYLQELLSPLGSVEIGKDVAGEVREIDVYFAPSPEPQIDKQTLGLLGRFTDTTALIERQSLMGETPKTALAHPFVMQPQSQKFVVAWVSCLILVPFLNVKLNVMIQDWKKIVYQSYGFSHRQHLKIF